jgi:large subunit ribosomal protein L1
MPKLARFARILGPKGLMPNPKSGTISDKPEEVARKFEKGLLRWKTEPKFPLIHQAVGKLSLDEEKLAANTLAFLKSVGRAHIRTAFIKATMTPSIKVNLDSLF